MPAENERLALVWDLGTTAVKAFVFNQKLALQAQARVLLRKIEKGRGQWEQDPQEILAVAKQAAAEALEKLEQPARKYHWLGAGLANQRETVVVWDKGSGKPIYPAILWQDRRTLETCHYLQERFGAYVRSQTGLMVEPYFSASKLEWIIRQSRQARMQAEQGLVQGGTVDSWFMRNFLEGEPFLTDTTNASRTLLFNIRELEWEQELLNIFGIPRQMLAEVKPSAAQFGFLKEEVVGMRMPLLAVAGDQQASMYAAGHRRGVTKVTYGTGTFIMQYIGGTFSLENPFYTTLAVSTVPEPKYVVEAKIDWGGREVEAVLGNPTLLRRTLERLAREVDGYLKQLPLPPHEIFIDGGVTRDGLLAKIQAAVSHVYVREHPIFDGTALGIARLIFREQD
jgi:glycerol kinase